MFPFKTKVEAPAAAVAPKTLLDLKNVLKAGAAFIKENKPKLKHYVLTPEGIKAHWDLYYAVAKTRRNFRHELIAYCELRGMERKRVEVPAENNLPDEELIKKIKASYLPVWRLDEDVHPGKA